MAGGMCRTWRHRCAGRRTVRPRTSALTLSIMQPRHHGNGKHPAGELCCAARQVFGQPVARVDHFGSYACRNIARSNRRSQHASANALDLAGFRLKDGTRITVARDWKGDDDKARFLRQVKAAACDTFRITLSPEYNAAHHDHLHVDMSGFGLCR